MARQVQRKVKRQSVSGRQAVVTHYHDRVWHDLPYWLKDWLVDNGGWIVLGLALLLAPTALLALVLGFHALPLEFLGIPSSANGIGLAAMALLFKFIFVSLAVRPLFRHERKAWYWLLAAAGVHFFHSLLLQHAITGGALLLSVIYLYTQLKDRY
jgi:hypothetical protein